MLILFGRDRNPVTIKFDPLGLKRCEFTGQVEAYVARRIEPHLIDAFEQHLIDCTTCLRAVHLGRVSNQLNPHNRSDGTPCAAQTMRKS
jgi:hypothetical protein